MLLLNHCGFDLLVSIKEFADVTGDFHCDGGDIVGNCLSLLVQGHVLLDSRDRCECKCERINFTLLLDYVHNSRIVFQSKKFMALVCGEINDCPCSVLRFPLVAVYLDFAPGHNGDMGVSTSMCVHGQGVPRLLKGVNHT